MINEIFNDIIKEESILFRGVNIGDNLKTVEHKEGNNFKKKIGSLSHYKYYFEVGETEDLILYYGFNKEVKKVDRIKLLFKAYPKYYWKKDGGKELFDFFGLIENNNLKKYLKTFNLVYNEVIKHFTDLLGKPKVETSDSVFNKPYQNFSKSFWVKNKLRLTITSYLDDNSGLQGPVFQLMEILLTSK
ncbi:MAG: hypothetical protein L3J23_06250 [Flavobacteriaceae bacterium]|nr:hypothetical protein [Flavobacteriaceae bacterium]